jgi:hypothetical protein
VDEEGVSEETAVEETAVEETAVEETPSEEGGVEETASLLEGASEEVGVAEEEGAAEEEGTAEEEGAAEEEGGEAEVVGTAEVGVAEVSPVGVAKIPRSEKSLDTRAEPEETALATPASVVKDFTLAVNRFQYRVFSLWTLLMACWTL